jgi:putative CocE/NonD family hydrolase
MPTDSAYPRNQALYLPMRDGVRIAIDVWLPAGLAVGATVPTLMHATRYWRARGMVDRNLEADSNFAMAERLNGAGYAYVVVDARGTGASFGVCTASYSPDEVADYGEIVRWIAAQPWSNQRVGTFGISYAANTAELTATAAPSALKAIAPRFSDFDVYDQLLFPGGVFFDWFLRTWGDGNRKLDSNDICALSGVEGAACEELKRRVTGVKPVDADHDGSLLAAAVAEHAANHRVYDMRRNVEFKDDPVAWAGDTMLEACVWSHRDAIERSGVAYQAWASWLDAGTQLGALSRYNTFANPQQLIIGAWTHGARWEADPFHTGAEPREADLDTQYAQLLGFFNPLLRDDAPGHTPPRGIAYYVLNSGEWRTTPVWPPTGVSTQRWFLGAQQTLTTDAPAASGADDYTVDFSATTGPDNRWHTQFGGSIVRYPNRAAAAEKLLCYRSAPLERDLEVVGHPVVALQVASTHTDGAFYVYLEDVAPDGAVTYVTEGILRASQRAVSDATPPVATYGPWQRHLRADYAPLTPGEPTELRFALFPTAVRFERGHRLQVAIAGHDADSFLRIPAEGTPTITVQHGSWIELPVAEVDA